jgi:hypothetical protein
MHDDDMLAATRSSLASIKDSLTDVHMDRPAEAIIAQARGRRLRRGLAGISAGGLALGIGLALTLSSSPSAARTVHVNLEAWSVNATSAGLVKVTIRQLKDPARLSQTLADAGVPVRLTFGRVCSPVSGDLPQLPQVLHKLAGRGDLVLTIDPAAMPAGTELVIGIGTFRQGSEQGPAAAFSLIKDGSPLACHTGKPGPTRTASQ